jgi:hypothetical protein
MEWKMETPRFAVHEVGSHGKTWSLDWRVPIALVIAMAFQFLAYAWFAIGPPAHRDDQDGRAVPSKAETARMGREGTGITTTLSRIDHNLDVLLASLIRMERLLKRHPDDGR